MLRWLLIITSLAILVHAPALSLPLFEDSVHSVHQAAVTWKDPPNWLAPWMGGAFRPLPKLYFMLGFQLWGTVAWPYVAFNLLLHGGITWLWTDIVRRYTASVPLAVLAGTFVAVGTGAYGKAVYKASNATMLLATLLLLLSLRFLFNRRFVPAGLCFGLAVLSHEAVVVAAVVVPAIVYFGRTPLNLSSEQPPEVGRPRSPRSIARVALVSALLLIVVCAFFQGRVGAFARTIVGLFSFALLPVNPGPGLALRLGEMGIPGIAGSLVANRFWLSLLPFAATVWLVWRGGRLVTMGLIWFVGFWIPAAWLMSSWPGDWLEIRYLYLPSLGLGVLAAHGVRALRTRGRVAFGVAVAAVVLWSVALDGVMFWKSREFAYDASQVTRRQELADELVRLDPAWRGK